MAHVSNEKKQIIQDYINLIKEYPIIGTVNMENLPAPQLQNMREQLRDTIILKVSKRRLIKIALENSGKNDINKLISHLKGQPALLFTRENPFKLFKTLEKSKSSAPAKGGQISPKDIIVPKGPTSFAPGPIIGELGMIGIKAGIENGKVAIKEDSLVVKEGEVIKQNVASILTRLKIKPMEIGLNITAMFEAGDIFTKNILSVDEKEYINNITQAHNWSFNLSIEAGIYNKETVEFMVVKVFSDSKSLAISQDILTDATIGYILSKAETQMLTLKSKVPN